VFAVALVGNLVRKNMSTFGERWRYTKKKLLDFPWSYLHLRRKVEACIIHRPGWKGFISTIPSVGIDSKY
jgi:hypothetical protein